MHAYFQGQLTTSGQKREKSEILCLKHRNSTIGWQQQPVQLYEELCLVPFPMFPGPKAWKILQALKESWKHDEHAKLQSMKKWQSWIWYIFLFLKKKFLSKSNAISHQFSIEICINNLHCSTDSTKLIKQLAHFITEKCSSHVSSLDSH